MSDWVKDSAKLLGKRVKVTLVYGDDKSPAIVSVGKFLGFGGSGECEILEDDGFVHYCWPMLEVRLADGEPAGS